MLDIYNVYIILGNVKDALQMTDELLTFVPGHQRALGNRKFYQAAIDQNASPIVIDQKKVGPNVNY